MSERPFNTQSPVTEVPQGVLSQEDQEALDYYMQGGKRAVKRGYQGIERRSNTRLTDSFIYTLVGTKYTGDQMTRRGQVLNQFRDWAPTSLQEANSALEGATSRVSKAANINDGALKDRYYTIGGYVLDAAEDKYIMDQGMEHAPDRDPEPNLATIRQSESILGVIEKQLVNRSFSWDQHWPARTNNAYKERHQYWHGFTLAAARFASDDAIIELYNFAKQRTDSRFDYWLKEQQLIDKMPPISDMVNKGEIRRISLLGLINRKAAELEGQQVLVDELPKEGVNLEALLPEDVRSQMEQQRKTEKQLAELADREYENALEKKMQIPMMTMERARRELAAEGIGPLALSQDRHEEEIRREIEEITERANRPKAKNERAPRRFKRKPTIGRAADTADSDKRVKDQYSGQDTLF